MAQQRTVKEIVARIDERTEWIVCELKKVRTHQQEHSQRLRALEQFRSWIIGIGAAAGATAGLLVKFVLSLGG